MKNVNIPKIVTKFFQDTVKNGNFTNNNINMSTACMHMYPLIKFRRLYYHVIFKY